MKTGVECEYFLLSPDGKALAARARHPGETLLRPVGPDAPLPGDHRDLRRDVQLGWGAYQNDHEDANGQFEMNWAYSDALTTADRHVFFKYMVKTLAEKHGLRATFMPKPFRHLTGNGCHATPRSQGRERREEPVPRRGQRARPLQARLQLLGQRDERRRRAVRRLQPDREQLQADQRPSATLSGMPWSPNAVNYSGNNRTHMITHPRRPAASSSASSTAPPTPTSWTAVLLLGQDGMRKGRDPGPRLECNMYTEAPTTPT